MTTRINLSPTEQAFVQGLGRGKPPTTACISAGLSLGMSTCWPAPRLALRFGSWPASSTEWFTALNSGRNLMRGSPTNLAEPVSPKARFYRNAGKTTTAPISPVKLATKRLVQRCQTAMRDLAAGEAFADIAQAEAAQVELRAVSRLLRGVVPGAGDH
jgi:hypothetical protein